MLNLFPSVNEWWFLNGSTARKQALKTTGQGSKNGSKLFSVDERSSALFLYKKGHHLSSYATIKAIKPNQSKV